ncbi:MAG: methyltransferase domain-containing protein [Patescibacteria group bacterium]|jgi:ubiquinone/menaquinone biosynthesis C-methylase UbiE
MKQDLYSQKSKVQKKYYNDTAAKYDDWHINPPSAKIVDVWNFANLKKFLGDKHINKSLELGCGTGRLANSLFKISDEVYGVDISEEVLKIAKQKYPNLKLECSEVTKLPYQDDYFDMVIINGSLHHFFAVEKTFNEAYRVLKTGGAFVLLGEPSSQFIKPYNPFFYTWAINRVINKLFGFLKLNKASQEEIEPDAESYKPWKLKKQLESTNFKVVDFYTYDYFVRTNNKFLLKFYRPYLNFEHKTLAKIFPYLGLAIQAFSIKK